MDIYVAGSLREYKEPQGNGWYQESPQDKKQREEQEAKEFEAAGRALGYALARAGHTIRVGVSNWQMLTDGKAITEYILDGAYQAGQEFHTHTRVISYMPGARIPDDNIGPVQEKLKQIKRLEGVRDEGGVRLDHRFLPVSSTGVPLPQELDEVDAFILVGGSRGTEDLGYSALALRRPVVALTAFGRAAKHLYDTILYPEYGREGECPVAELCGDWRVETPPVAGQQAMPDPVRENRSHADKVVELTQRLVHSARRRNTAGMPALVATLAASGLLLVFWLGIYISQIRPAPAEVDLTARNVAFFSLLYISAILGASLRVLSLYQSNEIRSLSGRWLAVELFIAAIIAFGLALVYLIGGISFTGTVVTLAPAGDNGFDAFATIAVSMSLLGLAAGFLRPMDQLRRRLESAIAEQDTAHQPAA